MSCFGCVWPRSPPSTRAVKSKKYFHDSFFKKLCAKKKNCALLLFCIFCYHSLFGEWSAGQLPAIPSDGLLDSDFFLRHSSPPQRATDSILRPPLSHLCDSFACRSLRLRYADFLQNFCSAEICTTSLHQQGRDPFVHSLFHFFLEKRRF